MLDQQTKQKFQQNFMQLKPQLKQAFPDVEEQDLQMGKDDPEILISTIEEKTGTPKEQVEQQLKQLVSNS